MTTTCYRIRVQEHLSEARSAWFDGMTIAREPDGTTSLTGRVTDQPALHGLLVRVRDLGLTLVSVERVEPGGAA